MPVVLLFACKCEIGLQHYTHISVILQLNIGTKFIEAKLKHIKLCHLVIAGFKGQVNITKWCVPFFKVGHD